MKKQPTDAGSGINWTEIVKKLPTEKTKVQALRRKDLFMQFDPNGNGYLSLAEVQKGVRDILNIPQLFNSKAAMLRAF